MRATLNWEQYRLVSLASVLAVSGLETHKSSRITSQIWHRPDTTQLLHLSDLRLTVCPLSFFRLLKMFAKRAEVRTATHTPGSSLDKEFLFRLDDPRLNSGCGCKLYKHLPGSGSAVISCQGYCSSGVACFAHPQPSQ